jgi:hypothetical protein
MEITGESMDMLKVLLATLVPEAVLTELRAVIFPSFTLRAVLKPVSVLLSVLEPLSALSAPLPFEEEMSVLVAVLRAELSIGIADPRGKSIGGERRGEEMTLGNEDDESLRLKSLLGESPLPPPRGLELWFEDGDSKWCVSTIWGPCSPSTRASRVMALLREARFHSTRILRLSTSIPFVAFFAVSAQSLKDIYFSRNIKIDSGELVYVCT